MSGHTPGPWYIDADEPEAKGIPITDGAGFIADVGTLGPSDDEDRANARAIAALPELIAALESLSGWSLDAHWYEITKDLASIIDDANAAIAKAQGGEA